MFEISSQQIQLRLPEAAVALDPVARPSQRLRPELGRAHATRALDSGELGPLQHADVLRHGGQRHVEARCELTDRAVAGGELGEDRTPRGVGERGEGAVERPLIVNHVVYYCMPRTGVSSPAVPNGRTVERSNGGAERHVIPTPSETRGRDLLASQLSRPGR